MRIGLSPRRTQALISAVLIAVTPVAAFAAPQDRFYERSFVLAANDRCGAAKAATGVAAISTAEIRAWVRRGERPILMPRP